MRAVLRNAVREISARGVRPCLRQSITSSPQRRAALSLSGCVAGMSFKPIGDSPSVVSTIAMVLAVNWPPQAPAPPQASHSTARSSASSILPAPCAPTASNTCWMVIGRFLCRPCAMVPPYSATAGISRRAIAIAAAGMVLSQPHSTTMASHRWPSTAASMESVMTSRLTSE
ncbi:hypothetical protein RLIN73S_02495 [Rhodanobacter lindaniclasticus]